MKKLKMKASLKYLILAVIDLVVLLNLPLILKDANTINAYRYDWCIIFIFVIINVISILKISEK